MSDTDSFINEVSEELRRDQLFAFIRRYAWIAAAIVVAIVGTAAWNEYSKAKAEAAAQAFGDRVLTALEGEDNKARVSALQEITTSSPTQDAILALLIAGEAQADDDGASFDAALDKITTLSDVPSIYHDIATFKAATDASSGLDAAARKAALEGLVSRGGIMRLMAHEQLALLMLSQGDKDGAISSFIDIIQDSEITPSLRSRAGQMIIALGGELPDLSSSFVQ